MCNCEKDKPCDLRRCPICGKWKVSDVPQCSVCFLATIIGAGQIAARRADSNSGDES